MELIGIFSILIGFIGFALSISAIKKSNNPKENTLAQVSYYNYNDASSPEKLSAEEQKLIEYFIQQISNNKIGVVQISKSTNGDIEMRLELEDKKNKQQN